MFSVVIPLYNKAHTIKSTLQSVLNQTYTNFEIIIVNDGSTDQSIEVINQSFFDNRIKIIHQQNSGVSAARNKGVSESSFEHIAFLDGDDELLPNYLLKMKEAIALFPLAGMYCCAGKLRFANGTELLRYSKKFQLQIQQIDFFENPFFFTNSSSTIVTKTAFNQTEGFPVGVKFNEDIQFFCSLALLVEVVYCPFPLSIYMKEVEGHASFDNSNDYAIIAQRTNVVFRNWQKSSKKNKTFLIFTRYEIRNELVQYLRNKEYKKLDYLLSRLDPALLKCFPSIELKFYQKKNLRLGNIFYIYLTKLRWKLRGYPVPKYKSV